MTTLTRALLNKSGCGEPNCTHDHTVLFFHSRCHPRAGTRVSYDKRTGALTVVCQKCKKPVAEVAVA